MVASPSAGGPALSESPPLTAKQKASLATKAAYSVAAEQRLTEAETRLTGVNARIQSATIAGHIVMTRQLEIAQRAVDANLQAIKANIECLRKSGDEAWTEDARNIDTAWENLSQSIKRLVAGYSDGIK